MVTSFVVFDCTSAGRGGGGGGGGGGGALCRSKVFFNGDQLWNTRGFFLAPGGGCTMALFEQRLPVYSMSTDGQMRGKLSGQELVLIVGNGHPNDSFYVPQQTSLNELAACDQIKTSFALVPRHYGSSAVLCEMMHAGLDYHNITTTTNVLSTAFSDIVCTCLDNSHRYLNDFDDDNDDDVVYFNDLNNW